jgi:hypothetical protein
VIVVISESNPEDYSFPLLFIVGAAPGELRLSPDFDVTPICIYRALPATKASLVKQQTNTQEPSDQLWATSSVNLQQALLEMVVFELETWYLASLIKCWL